MFEKETKFITDYILNKIKNIGTGVTVDNLLPKGVHPAILKYISSELDYLIFSERKRLIDNSAFDYSGPEIARYFTLIAEQIKKTKIIGFEDIRKLVVQAVSFNLNFISRPKWALIKLIFDGRENASSQEVRMLLNHIYYYDYLKNIISTYIDKRQLKTLSAIEFELIINKVDKELFAVEGKKLIENSLWSLGEFINIGGSSSTKIPVQPLELFLKEKNQIEMLFRLRRALPIESKQRYEIEDIKKVLFSNIPVEKFTDIVDKTYDDNSEEQESISDAHDIHITEEYEKPNSADTPEAEDHLPEVDFLGKEEFQTETISEKNEIEKTTEEIVTPEKEDQPDKPENAEYYKDEENVSIVPEKIDEEFENTFPEDDLLKLYDEELKSLEELEKELDLTTSQITESKFVFEEDVIKDRGEEIEKELLNSDEFAVTSEDGDIDADNEERLEHLADAEESKTKEKSRFNFFRKKEQPGKDEPKDIISFFTEKEINKIISVVFNEDKDDFTTTLEKIAECKNYDEATEIIKSVFLTYRINPYTREAVMLTNAVANYFNQG